MSAELAPVTFASLPLALRLACFGRVPVDARLRCAEVCRAWRAATREKRLWQRVDLSRFGGVTCAASDVLLRAVSCKACGQLEALEIGGCECITDAALLEVLADNAASMRELRMCGAMRDGFLLERILRTAPLLQLLDADAKLSHAVVHRALRNEPPFAPLRVHELLLAGQRGHRTDVAALAADVDVHASLTRVTLACCTLDVVPESLQLADALTARGVSAIDFQFCEFGNEPCSDALARLLRGGGLRALTLRGRVWLGDVADVEVLCAALRANASLALLELAETGMWRHPPAAAALYAALTAHPSLRTLRLLEEHAAPTQAEVVSAALGALVAANSPTLTSLCISHAARDDVSLGALLAALPQNEHLQELAIDIADISEADARDSLLPAVLDNASLRHLVCNARLFVTGKEERPWALSAREAIKFVKEREEARVRDAEETAAAQ